MSESSTSERMLAAYERSRQALELRKAGYSFPKIAEALGYKGPSGAYDAVHSAIRRTLTEPAREVVDLELARLDALLVAVWPNAIRGDDKAIRRVLDIMERRSKYLGLDAPTKIDISGMVREEALRAGLTEDDAEAAVREAQRIAQGAQ